MDGASEQTGRKTTFMQQLRKHHIDFHITEPERYSQSKAEGVIREIRKKWFRVMTKSAVPKRLWDYGLRWVVEIMQQTASDAGDLRGRTSLEKVTRRTCLRKWTMKAIVMSSCTKSSTTVRTGRRSNNRTPF